MAKKPSKRVLAIMDDSEKEAVKKSGTYKGKSNKLGYGGRAAQLKAKGVPGGVIGKYARRDQAAKGQKNYHGK